MRYDTCTGERCERERVGVDLKGAGSDAGEPCTLLPVGGTGRRTSKEGKREAGTRLRKGIHVETDVAAARARG